MNQAELAAALDTLGMPVAYAEFIKPTKPPFITYQFTAAADLKADNHNYVEVSGFQVELYTVGKDLASEALIQALLKSLRLPYTKFETWLESEKLRQVVYGVELI